MRHLYIESEFGNIYSVLHTPSSSYHPQATALICNPIGQEYIRCHKSCLALATKLSQMGIPCLRFDYLNTGDSSGSFETSTLSRYILSIELAAQKLRSEYKTSHMIIIGIRFGASLVLKYSEQHFTDNLVLWYPVLDGAEYVKEKANDHENWLSSSFSKEKAISGISNLGFHFSNEFWDELSKVYISFEEIKTKKCLLISNHSGLPSDKLSYSLEFLEARNTNFWIKKENEYEKSMVPIYEVLQIVDWVAKSKDD